MPSRAFSVGKHALAKYPHCIVPLCILDEQKIADSRSVLELGPVKSACGNGSRGSGTIPVG
jgi:hypothetical protein